MTIRNQKIKNFLLKLLGISPRDVHRFKIVRENYSDIGDPADPYSFATHNVWEECECGCGAKRKRKIRFWY